MRKEHLNLPLTQSQSLLWIGQEMNPESPMYNMVMSYEFKGAISPAKFNIAFQELITQSDALRSVFLVEEGIPVQKYLPTINYEFEFVDFSNDINPKETYKNWEKQRVSKQFDLEKCLFDSVLIKLSETNFIWYINQHHLITDGWSTTIIFSKMSDLYAKALQNNIENLEELPTYQSYAVYCKEIVTSGKTEAALKHWQEKLLDLPSSQPLYFKKETPLKTSSERSLIKLGKDRSLKIEELANKKGIRGWTIDSTKYNLFLTILFSFLYRITGQERLLVGSPTHNRTSKKFKNTIGLFIETFPLQITIESGETFLSLFKKIQIESNSFLKNAQAGTSTPALNRNFNTFFNYINATNTAFSNIPVHTSWVHPGHTDPRHHIRLHVHDFDNTGEIQFYFDLNTHVFNTEERALLPQHFLALLDACIIDPQQEIAATPIITETEVSKIATWNTTNITYDQDETLLSKFALQVLKTPDHKALIFRDGKLTYKELDHKSNQIARFLIKQGIKKNDIVIISMDRSLEMMICLYGIIKAGAAYLPVATSIPSERLDFIIKDAQSALLFYNHNNLTDKVKNKIDCHHIAALKDEISLLDVSPNNIVIHPKDLAYVIYTSGSTGDPKGVKCHHRGICNRLNWMNADHPLTSRDVLLQKTPITFDVSLWELFWPLQTGASLVVESPEGHKNPEKLIQTIQEHQVTIIHFVPSMLNLFIDTKGVENCASLQKIFCSGEALPASLVAKTYSQLKIDIYNLYGPTEASVDVTSWLCEKGNDVHSIPIGRPVANTKLYIVDEHMNLSPIGIPGELYISGKQVAQGYLHREELTKERFLANIFNEDSQNKMYKTGDLVKYGEDGVIEYLGRIDNQIKLRGQRIELGEIEKTLEKYPEISQAIVSVDSQSNLVAHFTGNDINPSEIRTSLSNRLPSYMIPSAFVHLEQFELLSSGKINRKKILIDNPILKVKNKITRVAPQNEIEAIIHNVWTEVMNIEVIGIHENFIRIGGNSLIAISITSRLKEMLELEVSINDVFNYPTIQSYAAQIEKIITQLLNEL